MSKLGEAAKVILMKAVRRMGNKRKVAYYYGIPPTMLDENCDIGALTAREVIRIEISRMEAERKGIENFTPNHKDKYKGTRSH